MIITSNKQLTKYADFASFPATGSGSFLYLDEALNKLYYWNGSNYVFIDSGGEAGGGAELLFFTNAAAFPAVGEINRLYIAEDSGLLYRWDGAAYVELSPAVSLPNLREVRFGLTLPAAANVWTVVSVAPAFANSLLSVNVTKNSGGAAVFGVRPRVYSFANAAAFPAVGEAFRLYYDIAANLYYRWDGAAYFLENLGTNNRSFFIDRFSELYFQVNADSNAEFEILTGVTSGAAFWVSSITK